MLKDIADFDVIGVFLSPLLFATQNSDIPIPGFMHEQWVVTLDWGRVKCKVVPLHAMNEHGEFIK